MNRNQQRRFNKFQRESTYMADHIADFPADSQGGKIAILYNAIITEIQTLIANQISGSDNKNQGHNVKDDAVDNLREEITHINLAAKAMADEVQGIENKFRLPYTRSLQVLIGTSRSFLNDAEPLKAKFIEYGLDEDFLEELQNLITEVEAASSSVDSAGAMRGEATGGLADAFKRGINLSHKLDSIVQIKYRHNQAKLAAWKIANHQERIPKLTQKPVTTSI